MPDESRAVVLWRPPAEAVEHEQKMAAAKRAEADARLAIARQREQHAKMLQTGTELVLSQLEKWLTMAQDPDFAGSLGPLDPKVILKIMEFVSKNYRLDTGQATENIAHAVQPSLDFSKLSQEERDAWRALVTKGQAGQ